jgi:predicted dehydrogenase
VDLRGARHDEPELKSLEIPPELRSVPAEVPDGTPVNLAQLMRRFAEGIRGKDHPEPTFADAVRNHRLLDAIVRASVSGTTVKL